MVFVNISHLFFAFERWCWCWETQAHRSDRRLVLLLKGGSNTHYTLEFTKIQSIWFADLVHSLECCQTHTQIYYLHSAFLPCAFLASYCNESRVVSGEWD